MRISISGVDRKKAVEMLEQKLNVNAIVPFMESKDYAILDYAAETYKYFGNKDVVFDGSVLDAIRDFGDSGFNDLQEQIVLNSLSNLDRVYVILPVTDSDDNVSYKNYRTYAELCPNKVFIIHSEKEIEL